MYAVVRTGGKQYKVEEGQKFTVEKLEGDVGAKLKLEDVLLVSKKDGEATIGKPVVEGALVECEILAHAKAKKIIVVKFKRRKNYRRRLGHRQNYTMLKVNKIKA